MQVQSRSDRDSTSLNTMVFADLVTQRPTDRALRILDLGCVCQATIDFFSEFHCHILVTGLCDEYIPGKGLDSQSMQQLHQLIEQDSRRQNDNHYDLILCWDLFNYLDKEQFQALVAQLQPALTNNTRCHAFLYTTACRPMRPGGFSIISSEQMLVTANATEQHHADSVTQITLGKYLPNYYTLRTVLMRNGTQELAFESRC